MKDFRPEKLKTFINFSSPFYDDFRYLNFTSFTVNSGGHFNLRDGIFSVPYSGTYMFSLHAAPVKWKPLKLQIHRNGIAVAAVSNGDTGHATVG